jgi:thiol-disulfide isomerase/thioredoxin
MNQSTCGLLSILIFLLQPIGVNSFIAPSNGHSNKVGWQTNTAKLSHDGDKETFSTSSKFSEGKVNKIVVPQITTIHNLSEFLDFLAESDDRVVVVEYYAAWCKSCHKFNVKYKQLANKYADKINEDGDIVEDGSVRFAKVEYGANVRLCKTFGIKKLPYVHMYKAPLGKITEFVCGPKFFDERLKTRLEKYLSMSDEEIKFSRDMEEGQVLGDDILEEVKKLAQTENSK